MDPVQLTPGRLLRAVVLGVALLIISAVVIYQSFLHLHPVYQKGVSLVQANPVAHALLGQMIFPSFWVQGRAWRKFASIEFGVKGAKGKAKASVVATFGPDGWQIRYILLKQPGQRGQALPDVEGITFD